MRYRASQLAVALGGFGLLLTLTTFPASAAESNAKRDYDERLAQCQRITVQADRDQCVQDAVEKFKQDRDVDERRARQAREVTKFRSQGQPSSRVRPREDFP